MLKDLVGQCFNESYLKHEGKFYCMCVRKSAAAKVLLAAKNVNTFVPTIIFCLQFLVKVDE